MIPLYNQLQGYHLQSEKSPQESICLGIFQSSTLAYFNDKSTPLNFFGTRNSKNSFRDVQKGKLKYETREGTLGRGGGLTAHP